MTFHPPLIGILGGMGPQAGIDMAEKLTAHTPARLDQEHVPFILFSLPGRIPDRTSFLFGDEDVNPAEAIADQFEKMALTGVTTAVMACNTAHAGPIFDVAMEILSKRGVVLEIRHLIRETAAYIKRELPGVSRVGVLGTRGTYRLQIYEDALNREKLVPILPSDFVRDQHINQALYDPGYGLKAHSNPATEEARNHLITAIEDVSARGAEAIVLGCTELPLAIKDSSIGGLPILDPARIMVDLLIRQVYPDGPDGKTA